MKKTMIYFKGIYDTLDLFTEQLKVAFEAMGFLSFVYDARLADAGKAALLEQLEQPGREFVCVTFNNLGYNLALPDGRNIWDAYGIPYLNILMDHPFHFGTPLKGAPSTAFVLCTDYNHVKYIRRFHKNIAKTDFLPHAGVELGSRHKPLRERSMDVLYAGALPVYTVDKMIPDLNAIPEVNGQEMMQEVFGELVRHPGKTTEQALEEYIRSQRNDISDERLQELIVQMRFLDSYATSFFREQAVRLLVESGISVTAYGVGWNQCAWSDSPYLTYGGKVAASEILPLMNDAKLVLNTMTWFKAGAHDRIFNGMLAGAAVVTDASSYLKREFADGRELLMFELDDIRTLPERVFDLFGHLDKAQQMADEGHRAAREHHTWKSRAEYIAECWL
ncbi:MAG: glycosyltransferase [Clostridiales bacterium]|nr:glycosyltransferase [Clostridiales bacterium]